MEGGGEVGINDFRWKYNHEITAIPFAGLGVDINTANYSMSELNIAINAQHLKQVPQL